MAATLLQLFTTALLCVSVFSQQCPPPTIAQIDSVLSIVRNGLGAEGGVGPATIIESHITAVAVGTTRNMYREVAVAVKYNTTGSTGDFTGHLQIVCSGGTTYGSKDFERPPPAVAFTTTRRNDCRAVFGPGVVDGQPTYDSDTNCLECSSSCNTGLRQCTNTAGTACCSFYNMEDMCVTTCPANSAPDSTFTCVCDAGFMTNGSTCVDVCTNDTTCQNGGTCTTVNGGMVQCVCPPGFTGANCADVVISSVPAPTPTPSLIVVTSPTPTSPVCNIEGCLRCATEDCCDMCNTNTHVLTGCICQLKATEPTEPQPQCFQCLTPCPDYTCCRTCQENYVQANGCNCSAITVTEPPPPGITDASVAGIAIGVILLIILLIALAVLVSYLIYAFVSKAAAAKTAKSAAPFGNGDSHENPLYINPNELTGMLDDPENA